MNQRVFPDKDLTDAERRIANIAIMGSVSEIDTSKARVRISYGDNTTAWLPFATSRAGLDRVWHPPEVGEQVLVVCPCGDSNQGVVVGSVYCDTHPAPASSIDVSRAEYKDGGFTQYDREKHEYTLNVPTGGSISLHIGQTTLELRDDGTTLTTPKLTVDSPLNEFSGHVRISRGISVQNSDGSGTAKIVGDIVQQGNHFVSGGDVVADSVALKSHRHMEQGDGAPTGASIP